MFRDFTTHTKTLSAFIVCLFLSMLFPSLLFARSKEFTLSCPYWYIDYDRAGYVDITWWYPSPMHPFPAHEMMTGDFAAACWYQNINEDNKAEWLTDRFVIPSFYTDSPFSFDAPANEAYDTYNDPCNPVWDFNQPSNPPYSTYQYDAGWSKIDDDKLEITIHYEVVDLSEYSWSPLSFTDANGSNYVKSERYIILQTYVFKNVHATEDINDLEFYQMLHGHPTGSYPIYTNATYDTNLYVDALENYTPYDSNHQVGNFRYDITLWNVEAPSGAPDHFDYMSLSSTIEPNDVGLDTFTAQNTGMEYDIKNRNLNGEHSISANEAAGAMMWYLGDLEPGQSTSITLALMYGSNNWPFPTILTKTNADPNNDCVRPFIGMGIEDNYLTYDICYDANGYPLDDAVIIDYLPIEIDYYSSDPCGTYDSNAHTVTWDIGDLSANDSNCIELVTKVNYYAKPGWEISNFVQMQCSEGVCAGTTTNVNVCYDGYGMDIIYVDKDANGFNNGTSWDNAYTDLRDGFTGAENGGSAVTAIWVAEGVYKPVYDANEPSYKDESFNLVEDVGVFGHFGGVGTYETSTGQRDFSNLDNTTILEGQIGAGDSDAVKYIIKAENIDSGLVDGFTIKGSYGSNAAGMYLDNSDVSVVNCKLKENDDYGIYAENYSYTDIHNCLFVSNSSRSINADTHCWPIVSYCTFDGNDATSEGVAISSYGILDIENSVFKNHFDNGIEASASNISIDHSIVEKSADNGLDLSSGCNLSLANSIVRYNGDYGIKLSDNIESTIYNNWIHNNGTDENASSGSGFYSSNHTVSALHLRNNTIYDNYSYGIECGENGADPNILNCIIAGNDSNDLYRENGSFNKVNYCLLQNAHAGSGNITGDPGFMNIDVDADDLHLDETSQCKDAGDPNGSYGDETDIDGESRIKYGRVDIGADEYYWSSADIDEDGFVNFIDYTTFASAWQADSGDGNYDENCDLEDNNSIDFNDLALFCEDWLWQAAWPDKQILLSTGFDSGIPGSWTVVDGFSDGKTWMTNNPYSRSSEYFDGTFCLVDSYWAGTVDMNESLVTPSIDCSGTVEVVLEFSHYFMYYSGGSNEKCDVDISIDSGAWQTILQYTGSSTGGYISEDISAYAAGESNVRIRWHYYNANYDEYWGIDNVKVIGNYRASSSQMSMGGGGSGFGLESMSLETTLSIESSKTVSASNKDALMLLTATESLNARPERLTAKSQKFYNITPDAIAKLQTVRPKPPTKRELYELHMELLKWLDEIWLNGQLESWTEDEYLEFRKSIEDSLQ